MAETANPSKAMFKFIERMLRIGEKMLLGGMQGMERVVQSDFHAPYISLVTGPPGSMKSSFCLTLLTNHLNRTGEFGLYCTVEETVDSLIRSIQPWFAVANEPTSH